LRGVSSDYAVKFLQTIERLIHGTSEGNPNVSGQTLDEEKNAFGDGDWVDLNNRVIRYDPEEWAIPHWNTKLYGGQQFERLLAEFKEVAMRTHITELGSDEIATAAGINKLNNVPNFAWAAADLSVQKANEAFIPLIEQLTARATYIVKRLAEIVERIIDQRFHSSNNSNAVNCNLYPYFTFHIKDIFYKFVDAAAENCKSKCFDEFYSSKTIYWELTVSKNDRKIPTGTSTEEVKDAVIQLANDLFSTLKQRITKNVLLKFYNFFLVPIQNDFFNVLQTKVNQLSDSDLERDFELSSEKQKRALSIKHLETSLVDIVKQEKLFGEYSGSISIPISMLE